MLLIQNKRVNWDTCQIGIPGATAKDKENRRIPFNPKGRLAAILKRRATLGPDAFVFGSTNGAYQPTIQTAWETLKLLANGIEPKAGEEGVKMEPEAAATIDLRWHDLRHEGACRLLADGVDIRIIQLMLGHASIQQTQRYLNVTDEELRKRIGGELEEPRRPLRSGIRTAECSLDCLGQIVPILSHGGTRKCGSSGWIRTSNPPVNSVMQVIGLAGSSCR